MKGFNSPSYQDFLVVWWNNFYQIISQINATDDDVMKISKAMMLLQRKENVKYLLVIPIP